MKLRKLGLRAPRRIPLPLPREERFFGLLRSGAERVLEAAATFGEMVNNYEDRHAKAAELKLIEERGDHIIHDIMRNLHLTFVTPLDREDIASLAEHLDEVIDAIEEAGRMLMEYSVEAPTERCKELAAIILHCGEELLMAVDKLRFRGRKLNELLPHTIELNRLENEADQVASKAIGELFRDAQPPLEVIKWREIYGMLERATDLAEDAANVLEGVVLKHA